jgi:hypothetical protein
VGVTPTALVPAGRGGCPKASLTAIRRFAHLELSYRLYLSLSITPAKNLVNAILMNCLELLLNIY